MSNPIPLTYKTTNWAECNTALKWRGSLTIWFDPHMTWEAVPSGKRGRQQACSGAAIQTLEMRKTRGCRLLQDHGMKMHEVRDWLRHSTVTLTNTLYC